MSRRSGREGEDLALRFLTARGLVLLDRNVSFRGGELDLVMRDGSALVFVEVRQRSAHGLVDAAESVNAAKRRRLAGAAGHYLGHHPDLAEARCRFDVVAISAGGRDNHVRWYKNAFAPDESW